MKSEQFPKGEAQTDPRTQSADGSDMAGCPASGETAGTQASEISCPGECGLPSMGHLENLMAITSRLENRLNSPDHIPVDYSTKRNRDASVTPLSPMANDLNKLNSSIVPAIKKFRSAVAGLSKQSVSRPKKPYPDPLQSSSPIARGHLIDHLAAQPQSTPVKGPPPPAGSKFDIVDTGSGDSAPELIWHSDISIDNDALNQKFQYNSHDLPYLVIIEGTVPGRNFGKFDPIATGKLLARFIEGERRIYISGRNKIKISCERIEDANLLLISETFMDLGYRTLVPDQILYKKAFIHVKAEHSVTEIMENMDIRERLMVRTARRRFGRSNKGPTDIIDLQLITNFIPRNTFIFYVCHYLTPTIPPPKICFFLPVDQSCYCSM